MAYRVGVRGAAECGPVTPMVPGPRLELRNVGAVPWPADHAVGLRGRFRAPPSRGATVRMARSWRLLVRRVLDCCALEGADGVAEPAEGDVHAEGVAAGGVAGDAEEDGGSTVRDEGGEPAVFGLDETEEAFAREDGDATAVDGEPEREPGRGARRAERAEGGLERRGPDELGRKSEGDAVAARLLVTALTVRTDRERTDRDGEAGGEGEGAERLLGGVLQWEPARGGEGEPATGFGDEAGEGAEAGGAAERASRHRNGGLGE